ncbi:MULTISPECIES: transposase [unclassified Pseudomonas]|uniref:transposase n=1 Tax=unclassified Pseudomonas TaxID=196821 RepID=UPI003FA7916A
MSRQRRTFTPTFKREAASLVLDQGYSCPEAARSLDVGESLLRRWVTQLQLERGALRPLPRRSRWSSRPFRSFRPVSTGWSLRRKY